MKKVLIIGCNSVTKRIVEDICRTSNVVTEICIASKDKAQCNEVKKAINPGRVRIITAGVDVTNEEATLLMVKIFGPELIINLTPVALSQAVMKLAVKIGASYIDTQLDVSKDSYTPEGFLSKEFELFGDFRQAGLTAICGCGSESGLILSMVSDAVENDFDSVSSVDVIALNGEKQTAEDIVEDKKDEKKPEEVVFADPVLTMSDLEKQEKKAEVKVEAKAETKNVAHFIKDGKPTEVKVSEIKAKSSEGVSAEINDCAVVADFFKERPDVPNVRFFSDVVPVAEDYSSVEVVAPEHKRNDELISNLEKIGLLSKEEIEVGDIKIAPYEVLKALVTKADAEREAKINEAKELAKITGVVVKAPTEEERYKGNATIEVYVSGKKSGSDVNKMYSITTSNDRSYTDYEMSGLEFINSTVLLGVVKLMVQDKLNKPGVFTLNAFDSNMILNAIKENGIKIKNSDKEFTVD